MEGNAEEYKVFEIMKEVKITSFALFQKQKAANITFLPGTLKADEVFCTGASAIPLMDAFIQKNYPGKYFEENAAIALKGTVNEKLLSVLKDHSFFEQLFPKTTGPELFNLF